MKFPFWLIPIFAVVILLPYANKKQNKTWEKLTSREKKFIVALIVIGVIILGLLTAFLFLKN